MSRVILSAPDLVAALVAHVEAATGQRTLAMVPNPRPDEFVTLRELGGAGQRELVFYRSTLRYEAWSTSLQNARALGSQVRDAIRDASGRVLSGVQFYRVADAGGLMMLPDPDSTQPRYGGTVEVWVRQQ